ncbi:cytochrome C, partial [bacterium]
MKISRKDVLFIVIICAVLAVVILISGEETTRKVPYDGLHRQAYEVLAQTGSKREAEKGCEECHNDRQVRVPANHPP